MKRILLILLLFTAHSTFAQYVDSVEWFYDYDWNRTTTKDPKYTYYRKAYKVEYGNWYVGNFYVDTGLLQMRGAFSDDSMTVEEGKFSYYYRNGTLSEEGSFMHGKRVGLWRSYHKNGGLADSGYFATNGMPYHKHYQWDSDGNVVSYTEYDPKQTGAGHQTLYFTDSSISTYGRYSPGHLKDSIWTYYHRNGKIAGIETWDSGRWVDFKCFDEEGKPQVECDTFTPPKPDYNVYEYMGKRMTFPRGFKTAAVEAGVSGMYLVLVQFVVDENGKITAPEILKGYYTELNQEALRVVGKLPPWEPGREHNRRVKVYYKLPVTWSLR